MDAGDLPLARAFAAREAWAYEAAYRAYGALLFAAARRVLADAGGAQDCVHDVMLRLWQRGDAFRIERGSLRAFLAVCVRNEALRRRRDALNRERIVAAVAPAESAAVPDSTERVAARDEVERALAVLSPEHRLVLQLAYDRHMTHDAIAAQLSEPVGTIKSRLASALRRLREIFAREERAHAGS